MLRADESLSNGVKIHYVVSGKGEPVILVHGLYSSAKMNWRCQATMAIGEALPGHRIGPLRPRAVGQAGRRPLRCPEWPRYCAPDGSSTPSQSALGRLFRWAA